MFDYLVTWNGLQTLELILLIAGVVLLIVEACVPGFGVFGVLGILCLSVDIFLFAKSPLQGVLMFFGLIALIVILVSILVRFSRKGVILRNFILRSSTGAEQGYNSARDFSTLVDSSGLTLTPLRPAGEVEIGGKRYDVVSQGEYIDKGTEIRVIETEGNRIVVRSAV
jgi:membrane-bound serine protease (ClpP class)